MTAAVKAVLKRLLPVKHVFLEEVQVSSKYKKWRSKIPDILYPEPLKTQTLRCPVFEPRSVKS
jgi:hypothetical protein